MSQNSLQKRRVENGLCPQCGAEAAPYYLCAKCRQMRSLGRLLDRAEGHGFFRSEARGRSRMWFLPDSKPNADISEVMPQPYPLWGEGQGFDDARLRPKIKGLPVNVEATLIELMREEARPLTVEEISTAWGRLRLKANRVSAAHDLRALILAERRRQSRAAKRVTQS